jgi:hypothetical protein
MTKAVKRKPARRAARAEAKEAKPTVDPIFAAINVHRTALMARWAAFGAYGEIAADDPSYNKAEARANATMDREHEALKALVGCQPTTANGLMALLAYVGQPADGPDYELDRTETIIVGAFETNRITATEWSRNLGRTAKRIMDAKDARREP